MTTFVLLKITIGADTFFLNAAAVLTSAVAGMLSFVFLFRKQRYQQQQKRASVRHLFSDLIAETAICESPQEVQATLQAFLAVNSKLLQKPFARQVLIKALVKIKDDISGSSAENLRLLFEQLQLDKDCYQQFLSKQWHVKAKAIQQLAEMQQHHYLVKIYRETNHTNKFIRTEAQLAVVKLTGFKGLRFLNIINHPVSQWQQLSLLHQLKEGAAEETNIRQWLSSSNATVVEFALRLTEAYKCYPLYPDVVACLQHSSAVVRMQALHALRENYDDDTTAVLMQYFPTAGKPEQLLVLELLGELGTGEKELSFLKALLSAGDESLRYGASQAIQQIDPVNKDSGAEEVEAATLPLLSILTKKAV